MRYVQGSVIDRVAAREFQRGGHTFFSQIMISGAEGGEATEKQNSLRWGRKHVSPPHPPLVAQMDNDSGCWICIEFLELLNL